MENKKIEIRPIEKNSWHGKKGLESFAVTKKIKAFVDSKTGLYATGLTEKDIADLKAKGVSYDLTSNFNYLEPHPFWDSKTATVDLPNKTSFLNIAIPLDFIKYKIMLTSKFVANSKKEFDEGAYPEATHIIYDEEREIAGKVEKIAIKNTARILVSKLSETKKKELLLVITKENCREKSATFVSVAMDDLIEKHSQKIVDIMTKSGKDISYKALVIEALQRNIFKRKGTKINYFDVTIGTSIQDVVDYLKEDENQDDLLKIKNQLGK